MNPKSKIQNPKSKNLRRQRATHCATCGVAWIQHLGIAGTCKALADARGALKVIHTWATFRGGEELIPEHVERLTRQTLGLRPRREFPHP